MDFTFHRPVSAFVAVHLFTILTLFEYSSKSNGTNVRSFPLAFWKAYYANSMSNKSTVGLLKIGSQKICIVFQSGIVPCNIAQNAHEGAQNRDIVEV